MREYMNGRYSGTPANRDKAANRKSVAKDKKLRPERNNARVLVYHAVKRGDLVRPTSCPKCGSSDRRIDAHHRDYSKPLEVEWSCSRCHGREHRIYAV